MVSPIPANQTGRCRFRIPENIFFPSRASSPHHSIHHELNARLAFAGAASLREWGVRKGDA